MASDTSGSNEGWRVDTINIAGCAPTACQTPDTKASPHSGTAPVGLVGFECYRLTSSQHVYEVRPRKDKRGVDLISDALPFGRLWYDEPNAASNAIGYAEQ